MLRLTPASLNLSNARPKPPTGLWRISKKVLDMTETEKEQLFQDIVNDANDWRARVNEAWKDGCLTADDKLRIEILAAESSS